MNPVLGGTIAAGGNIITDAATGNIPDFNNFQDVLGYTAGNALDGLAVGGAGSIAKSGLNGLKHLGLDLTPDLALGAIDNASSLAYDLGFDIARDKSGEWIIDKATEEFLTLATGSPVSVIAKAPNHYLRSFRSIGATATSGLGIHGNSVNSTRPTQVYEHTFKSGNTYTGVGDVNGNRASHSARRLSRKYNDPLVSSKTTTLPTRSQAYGVEQVRIEMNGGVKSTRNYNRRNSPGLKIIKKLLR